MNITPINAINIKIANNKATKSPNFRSNNILTSDVVEIQETTSKGLSNTAKRGIGIVSAIALIGGIFAIMRKPKAQKDVINGTKKYFFDNVKELHLPENLQLPEFKNRNDAVKYAKETFKIDEVEDKVSFDAIKDVLRAMTDISNKHKGNFYSTNRIALKQGDNTITSIEGQAWESNFGTLNLYEHLYNPQRLDKYLAEDYRFMLYDNSNNPIFLFKDGKEEPISMMWNGVPAHYDMDLSRLLNKYYTSADKMTLKEKQNLVLSLNNVKNQTYIATETPMTMFKYLQKENPKVFEDSNINLDEIAKKTHEEQVKLLKQFILEKRDKCTFKIFGIKRIEDSVYHEFGHLQDAMRNKDILKDTNSYAERFAVKKKIAELKEKYKWFKEPEFLTNMDEQTTAAEVSHYATESVGEFIAETYEKLIKGEKVSDEVIALYKKYNGTLV